MALLLPTFCFEKKIGDWGYGSVVACLPCIHKALGSIPNTLKKKLYEHSCVSYARMLLRIGIVGKKYELFMYYIFFPTVLGIKLRASYTLNRHWSTEPYAQSRV